MKIKANNSALRVELQVLEIIETVEQNPKLECGDFKKKKKTC